MDNINQFDIDLARLLKEKPAEFHPLFEKSVKMCYMREFDKTEEESPDFQVLLFSNENTL